MPEKRISPRELHEKIKQIIITEAHNYLNYNFRLSLTLSDRIKLRDEVMQAIRDCGEDLHHYERPSHTAIARYLMKYAGFRDIESIQHVLMGYIEKRTVEEVQERHKKLVY